MKRVKLGNCSLCHPEQSKGSVFSQIVILLRIEK